MKKIYYLIPFVLLAVVVAVCCNVWITVVACILSALLAMGMYATVEEGEAKPLVAHEIGAALLGFVSSILLFFTEDGSMEKIVCMCAVDYFWVTILIDAFVCKKPKEA
ncbi:MAG: hypothetical protein J6N49_02430 [Alphaproteobacteria bacterium]|nr:hypothetical protein [Alphaproteobacteria bacterium]